MLAVLSRHWIAPSEQSRCKQSTAWLVQSAQSCPRQRPKLRRSPFPRRESSRAVQLVRRCAHAVSASFRPGGSLESTAHRLPSSLLLIHGGRNALAQARLHVCIYASVEHRRPPVGPACLQVRMLFTTDVYHRG